MASQVLSGSSNVSYTNNTGQNVRIVINYMASSSTTNAGGTVTYNVTMTWTGVTISNGLSGAFFSIGRNIAGVTAGDGNAGSSSNNVSKPTAGFLGNTFAYPTELMLAPGQTFSASCGAYNIVVIPEAG